MVDFSQIRSYKTGARDAFEELVCQLARLDKPEAFQEFRRIEGAGGDGGLEAYWLLSDGAKIGYQAKYFLHSRDIDWAQIDESVEQAIATHPTLKGYVVALPCDLTDRRGALGRGRTGWESWAAAKVKWEGWAKAKGITISFEVWPASEIVDRLVRPNAVGLRSFWFNTTELTQEWFYNKLQQTKRMLGERYHPEDHVDVSAQTIGQGVVRHERLKSELLDLRSRASQFPLVPTLSEAFVVQPKVETIKALETSTAELSSIDLDVPLDCNWPTSALEAACDAGMDAAQSLLDWAWSAEEAYRAAKINVPYALYRYRQRTSELYSELRDLRRILGSPVITAEKCRAAVIFGRAGTGKSHLLAHLADESVAEGRPVVMLTGSQFVSGPIWPQIANRLGLAGITQDVFLATLDTAAQTARKRALLVFDALNEGAGGTLWKDELPALIEAIKGYPHLSCLFSCRAEYLPFVIRNDVRASIPCVEIFGFATAEEQLAAAKVYLDKRGIVRPATPWLAPEFANPLFLRSATTALQKQSLREFPRGLRGASQIFDFFVTATARHLVPHYDGTDDLLQPTRNALAKIAAAMARSKAERIPEPKAFEIVEEAFFAKERQTGSTWLEVLQRNGLLQSYPTIELDPTTGLERSTEVIEFSFQRFQDHWVASGLLQEFSTPEHAFSSEGRLHFLVSEEQELWRHSGLVSALSTLMPERLGIELADALPGGAEEWLHEWSVHSGFEESIRWRSTTAFSDRTLALLNTLGHDRSLPLVLEQSTSEDHPYNAVFLDRQLSRRLMPERDAWWSVPVALATDDDDHPINQLIDWALEGAHFSPPCKSHWLAGLVLTWTLSTSSRVIRDRATKALTSLILKDPSIFPRLTEHFWQIDDLYITERLLAAGYGAACLQPTEPWLAGASEVVYKRYFDDVTPPLNIRLRDYGRGLLEIAQRNGTLYTAADPIKFAPPYNSAPPNFGIAEEDVKEVAEKAGDESILSSCTGWIGDFGTYEIKPGVDDFTLVPLGDPIPLTFEEKKRAFVEEVINIDSDRQMALQVFENSQAKLSYLKFRASTGNDDTKAVSELQEYVKKWMPRVEEAHDALLAVLPETEQARFRELYPLQFTGKTSGDGVPLVDTMQARLWVAKRSYELGWTKQLFPKELRSRDRVSRSRPKIERVGKKYQWLALSELQARLADNYWIKGGLSESARPYDNPLSIGFERDIDPTVLPTSSPKNDVARLHVDSIAGPEIILPEVADDDLLNWPSSTNPAKQFTNLIVRSDAHGDQWLTAFEHRSASAYGAPGNGESRGDLRQQEFRFISHVLVSQDDVAAIVAHLRSRRNLSIDDWKPNEFTDGPFLNEPSWRSVWAQDEWSSSEWALPKGVCYLQPVNSYTWESHLDCTLPDGYSAYRPAPLIMEALKLTPLDGYGSGMADKSGRPVFLSALRPDGGSIAAFRQDVLEDYLAKEGLVGLWLFLSERQVWIDGVMSDGPWALRRSEGVAWYDNGRWRQAAWVKDERR